MDSEDLLYLQQYGKNRDVEAFARIIDRHAGMVYQTCLRVTGNAHDAEDLVQECFLELARKTDAIKSSLPAWLHLTAVNRSKNVIRNNSTRRRHEKQAGMEKIMETEETTWAELGPHVDEALMQLPEDLRAPIILHFFEKKPQAEIAAELNLGRATVSRRIDKGIKDLRKKLKKAGIITSAAILTSLLVENTATAAVPKVLETAILKIAIAGVGKAANAAAGTAATVTTSAVETGTASTGGASAFSSITSAVTSSIKVKITTIAVAGALTLGGVITYQDLADNNPPTPPTPINGNIIVLDENNAPLPEMYLQAVNHENKSGGEAITDERGEAIINVEPGTWSFFAMPTHPEMWKHVGEGYLLAKNSIIIEDPSQKITLAPTTTVKVNLLSEIFNFVARENYLGFVVGSQGKYVRARYAGVTNTTQLLLHTNPGLQARAFVSPPRSYGKALFYVGEPRPLTSPFNIEVSEANTATLKINAQDAEGKPTAYNLQLHTDELAWDWSPLICDIPAEITEVLVSPHAYRMVRAVKINGGTPQTYWLSLNDISINLQAGRTLNLSMGGSLQNQVLFASIQENEPPEATTQLMFQVKDNFGNLVRGVSKDQNNFQRPRVMIKQGSLISLPLKGAPYATQNNFFLYHFKEEFLREDDPEYNITWDFGPWGSGNLVGKLFEQEELEFTNPDEIIEVF
ncbi:MAG: sigma-70 family RNA polymerase sigma factor [Planctomycetes bacterium]|nr:sigma-70 family RNA polymerase sigma factor [Planctomycetota bacterium]